MGVYTHWGGAGNGWAGGDRGVYQLPPEHGSTVHYDSSYHGIVSSGRVESGTAPIQAMMGAACSGYPGDKDGACRIRGGGGDGGGIIGGRGIGRGRGGLVQGRMKGVD